MVANARRITIGLLAPYSGTNLGDGAVQDAILVGLSKRIRGADFWGITLRPEETSRRHGIPAFPIMGLTVASYSAHETLFGIGNGSSQQGRPSAWCRAIERIKQGVKKVPVLAGGLGLLLKQLQQSR